MDYQRESRIRCRNESVTGKHHRRARNGHKLDKGLFLFGVASLLWFIFRTGTKPSRMAYPCQKAALANSSTLLGASILLSMTAGLTKAEKFVSRRAKTLVLLFIVVTTMIDIQQFWLGLGPAQAVDPNMELRLMLQPRNATGFPTSDIYAVNGRMPAPISELVNLMGSHGLLFYKSNITGMNQGPDGLMAPEDVVLIKVNEQWDQRGGTNTDVLTELIQTIVDHPDGFVGEIVIVDNGQGYGSMNWTQNNAEDHLQSIQDVVDVFSSCHNVSTCDWQSIRGTRVREYSEGDMFNGYVLYDIRDSETGIYVSYPKFQTDYGTCISFKSGVWNGTSYERRLKVINVPVLKSHSWYGVTAATKHYMGVLSENRFGSGGLSNGHDSVASGGMGTLMVETGLPTLNIIDAVWVNANPPPSSLDGPSTSYGAATRVNVLLASTDPVALDYWAAKHVLVQTARLIGYNDTHTVDPDNTNRSGTSGQAFGVWLNLTRDEMVRGGYNVTNDESRMNVYVYEAPNTGPIAITDLRATNSWAYLGWIVNATLTIKNRGNSTESLTTNVFYDDNLLASLAVNDILPDEERSTTIFWDTENVTPCANHKYIVYTLSASIPPKPYKNSTGYDYFTDGTIMFRIVGDVNGDCEVGIDDVYAASHAFGSCPEHQRWNEYADINQDRYVGIDDIFVTASHFGEEE